MLILVLDDIGAVAHTMLEQSPYTISYDKKDLPLAEALIVRSSKVTQEMISQAPLLKIISRAGVGMDSIDTEYAQSCGIITVNAHGGNVVNAAETTMGLILSLAHKIAYAHHLLYGHKIWERGLPTEGFELAGKVLGIVGCGNVGSRVAYFAHAFQMKVLVYDPYVVSIPDFSVKSDSLHELIQQSDLITLHTPLTDETYGMISGKEFALMKKTAYLINASRGKVVCEQDLIEALINNRIAGAALDVFWEEPLDSDSKLFKCDNIIMIPHLGGAGKECRERVSTLAVEHVLNNFRNRL